MSKDNGAIYTKSEFIAFVSTFADDVHGANAIPNYARFCNMDRSSISRNMSSDNSPPAIHKTIERLVNEREEAKAEVRRLKKLLKKVEK